MHTIVTIDPIRANGPRANRGEDARHDEQHSAHAEHCGLERWALAKQRSQRRVKEYHPERDIRNENPRDQCGTEAENAIAAVGGLENSTKPPQLGPSTLPLKPEIKRLALDKA